MVRDHHLCSYQQCVGLWAMHQGRRGIARAEDQLRRRRRGYLLPRGVRDQSDARGRIPRIPPQRRQQEQRRPHHQQSAQAQEASAQGSASDRAGESRAEEVEEPEARKQVASQGGVGIQAQTALRTRGATLY